MNEWEAKPAKAKRRQVPKSQEEHKSFEELEDHLSGHHIADGCEVCMPNIMRRERGRGGVALTSHVYYEDLITPDDRMFTLIAFRTMLQFCWNILDAKLSYGWPIFAFNSFMQY